MHRVTVRLRLRLRYGYGYKEQRKPHILVLVGHRNTEEKNSILIDVMVSFLLFILDRSSSGVISNSQNCVSHISYLPRVLPSRHRSTYVTLVQPRPHFLSDLLTSPGSFIFSSFIFHSSFYSYYTKRADDEPTLRPPTPAHSNPLTTQPCVASPRRHVFVSSCFSFHS